MDIQSSDPIDGTEADVADVLDQAEPARSEPIEDALEHRAPIDATPGAQWETAEAAPR